MREYHLKRVSALLRLLAKFYITLMRFVDNRAIKRIDLIITNSKNVQRRVKKFYKREAKVIYPGVSVGKSVTPKFKRFLLSVSRLYPEKRVHLATKAMKYLPDYKLFIAGDGPDKKTIKKIIVENNLSNVVLLGDISDQKLERLYNECFAVIYVPIDEDFGLVPIEANVHGKMVIGGKEGGLKETVVQGKSGILLTALTPRSIAQAVRKLEKLRPERNVNECILNAKRFSWEKFNKEIDGILGSFYERRRNNAYN